jgi:hypothetical protein
MTELDRVLAAYELDLADRPELQELAECLPIMNLDGVLDQAVIDELRRRLTGEE